MISNVTLITKRRVDDIALDAPKDSERTAMLPIRDSLGFKFFISPGSECGKNVLVVVVYHKVHLRQ